MMNTETVINIQKSTHAYYSKPSSGLMNSLYHKSGSAMHDLYPNVCIQSAWCLWKEETAGFKPYSALTMMVVLPASALNSEPNLV